MCIGTDPSQCQSDERQKLCYLEENQQCLPITGNRCSALEQSQCAAMLGCTWTVNCHGDLECGALRGEAQCKRHIHCDWRPSTL